MARANGQPGRWNFPEKLLPTYLYGKGMPETWSGSGAPPPGAGAPGVNRSKAPASISGLAVRMGSAERLSLVKTIVPARKFKRGQKCYARPLVAAQGDERRLVDHHARLQRAHPAA